MHLFSFQFKIKFKYQYILGTYTFQVLATIPKRYAISRYFYSSKNR